MALESSGVNYCLHKTNVKIQKDEPKKTTASDIEVGVIM
jgi:hypothetical protein